MCLPHDRAGDAEASRGGATESSDAAGALPQADAGFKAPFLAPDGTVMNDLTPKSPLSATERETAIVRFLWEVEENVSAMEKALASLLHNGVNLDLIEQLYYESYRIREGALAAGLTDVARLARVMENVFEHARRGQLEMTSYLITLLQPGCGALRQLTCEGVGGGAEEREALGEGESEEAAPESDVTTPVVSSS
jgi:hypothetical protein